MLGNVLIAVERYEEAVVATERALALSPNQAEILIGSAWVFAQNGRAREAVSLAETALRLNPYRPAWCFSALGDSLLFAKRFAEALPAQHRCVEQGPDNVWCRLGLALTYIELGMPEEASIHVGEATRVNPKLSAADNAYVRSIGDPAERAWAIESLRRAGLQ
jgi:tetratricopeptide (TPR) repeat protein